MNTSERRPLELVRLELRDVAPVRLLVEQLRFRHPIGDLFTLDMTGSTLDAVDLDGFIGQDVIVQLDGVAPWALDRIDGIIWRVRVLPDGGDGQARYALRVTPHAQLLSERDDTRIFQHLSSVAVVEQLLARSGRVRPPAQRLVEPHHEREYTVQYGESDHDCLQRIAAEDGITVCHQPRTGVSVLLDDTTTLDRSDALVLRCGKDSTGRAWDGVPRLWDIECGRELRTSRMTVGDYDCRKPRHAVGAQCRPALQAHEGENALDGYVFEVGRCVADDDGAVRARRLLEARRAGGTLLTGRVDLPLEAGRVIALEGHRRGIAEGEYLVIEARCDFEQGGTLACSISAIPLDTAYRRPRPSKPRIAGTQTATVVGAQGETVDVDDEGRIEVAFHWDRRRPTQPGASRRVRVSQSWGGAGHGMFTTPRIGDEVVVAFVDGDPDEPLIVGQVHNPARPSPLSPAEARTQSVWRSQTTGSGEITYNEVRMDDAPGAELLKTFAGRDSVATVARNQQTSVGGAYALNVGSSADPTLDVYSTRITGSETHQATGNMQFAAPNGEVATETKSFRLNVAEELFSAAKIVTSLATDKRIDESEKSHEIHTQRLVVDATESALICSPQQLLIAEDSITLMAGGGTLVLDGQGIRLFWGGSLVELGKDGIAIVTPGIVKINGSQVFIN